MIDVPRFCLGLLILGWVAMEFPSALAEPTAQKSGVAGAPARLFELEQHRRLRATRAGPHAKLSEFQTDGCSGGLSVGWDYLGSVVKKFRAVHGARPPWESCCVAHDRHYHQGGPADGTVEESYTARLKADLEFKACVRDAGAMRGRQLGAAYGLSGKDTAALYEHVAGLMYLAVRLGGLPCTGLSWRWGYGWPKCGSQ